jgi:hypothetical protein
MVLEGADGAGKTTLAGKLRDVAGAAYVHMTWRMHRTPEQFFNYQMACTRLALHLAHEQPVVLDRWWPSEEVYGPHFRQSVENPDSWRLLDHVAQRYGFTYVFCIPSDLQAQTARHAERAAAGGEMYSDISGIPGCYGRLYAEMHGGGRELRDDVVLYDMAKTPIDAVEGAARSLYEDACDRQAELFLGQSMSRDWMLDGHDRTFVGNPHARLMVAAPFGRSESYLRRGHWPGCDYREPGARWLLGTLENQGVRTEDVCLVDTSLANHFSEKSRDDVYELALGKRVVSLGCSKAQLQALALEPDLRLASPEFYVNFAGPAETKRFRDEIRELLR